MAATFLDTEEMAQALRHTNVMAMQSSRGKYRACLGMTTVRHWTLQVLSFEEGAAVCAGDAPRDAYAVLVPLVHVPNCRLLGQSLEEGTVGLYAPGGEHADTTRAGCRVAVIVAPSDFADFADREALALPRRGSCLHDSQREGLACLRELLCLIPQALAGYEEPGAREKVEAGLSDALYRAVTAALRPAGDLAAAVGRPRLPRTAILRRIAEVLELRKNERVCAVSLSAEVGISQASLQRVFQECYGMPPARYLGLRRLYLARKRLREGSCTVTEVVGSLGFGDQSRFSKGYKSVFGELPSDTLRTAKMP